MLVASGRVEAMIDPVVAYHDVSAVKIIIEEAGGVFSNLAGSPEWREEAMTSAPGVREEILRLLAL
jgi:fructose-1,6-bisphosphatase/inositol monophosphatase family enzyme